MAVIPGRVLSVVLSFINARPLQHVALRTARKCKEWYQDEEALRQGEVQVHWQSQYESLAGQGRIVFGNGTAQIMQYEKVCELCARGEPQGVAQFHAISPP